ncbi:hypothetical protein SAMN05192555_102352 [Franzmannia pantelleriensis]|uniref:Uncharacterized protein n=1 Tax=Franzmannia pantelleriensis TaxID=48727 RepID=A0A1G9H560_9GAMM|nr:hypothetical protein [Halomonas pantelleriensis]SDL08061.1 hypothetical protein SAMN05192555_102352 [Halomonas pantelleriensis]
MWLKLERWGIEFGVGSVIIRLVTGDVFIRVPMVGQLAWNPVSFSMDRWAYAKHDPVL